MRSLRATEPWLRPEELLRMVTVNPARALRRRGQLGKIVPGAFADLIALPAPGTLGGVYEDIVNHDRPVSWMMIDGQIHA
jgi:imidazolonepropionase-like amidohydrolase